MIKNIALIAHDNKKKDLMEWCKFNENTLKDIKLYATGTTGKLIEDHTRLHVNKLTSGPLGGDQQIGSLIVDNKIDLLIFLWDGLGYHPHDVDIKALLRIAVIYNVPTACNISTADYIISSELFNTNYKRKKIKYYRNQDGEYVGEM